MEFLRIKAGSFMMGNDPSRSEATESDEEPRHEVTLTQDFFIGAREVTQAQWEKLMGDNPSENQGADFPVENVAFEEVIEFLDVLNKNENTRRYRLPTEAEWEYAARAGTDTVWHFGDDPDLLTEYDWVSDNADETHETGTLKPNPWGLYDVHGNVKEIVSDYYNGGYYRKSPKTDPRGPSLLTSRGGSRVVRGGAWYNSPSRTRSSYRYFLKRGERDHNIGFRAAFSAEPKDDSLVCGAPGSHPPDRNPDDSAKDPSSGSADQEHNGIPSDRDYLDYITK
jgi:formylglycine-generating enzyme required for sulfatase activity